MGRRNRRFLVKVLALCLLSMKPFEYEGCVVVRTLCIFNRATSHCCGNANRNNSLLHDGARYILCTVRKPP